MTDGNLCVLDVVMGQRERERERAVTGGFTLMFGMFLAALANSQKFLRDDVSLCITGVCTV